jgi:hypothetical protein
LPASVTLCPSTGPTLPARAARCPSLRATARTSERHGHPSEHTAGTPRRDCRNSRPTARQPKGHCLPPRHAARPPSRLCPRAQLGARVSRPVPARRSVTATRRNTLPALRDGTARVPSGRAGLRGARATFKPTAPATSERARQQQRVCRPPRRTARLSSRPRRLPRNVLASSSGSAGLRGALRDFQADRAGHLGTCSRAAAVLPAAISLSSEGSEGRGESTASR